MIDLIFTACLLAAPATCERKALTYDEPGLTPQLCSMAAQFRLAEWVNGHPKYRVTKWRCERAGDGGTVL